MVHGYGWIMVDIRERANHTQSRMLEFIWNLNFNWSIQPIEKTSSRVKNIFSVDVQKNSTLLAATQQQKFIWFLTISTSAGQKLTSDS